MFDRNRKESNKIRGASVEASQADVAQKRTQMHQWRLQADAEWSEEAAKRKEALRQEHEAAKQLAEEGRRKEHARIQQQRKREQSEFQELKEVTEKETRDRREAARARAEQQRHQRETRNREANHLSTSASVGPRHRSPSPPRRPQSMRDLSADCPRDRWKKVRPPPVTVVVPPVWSPRPGGEGSRRAARGDSRSAVAKRRGEQRSARGISANREEEFPPDPEWWRLDDNAEQEWIHRYNQAFGRGISDESRCCGGRLQEAPAPPMREIAWKLRWDVRKHKDLARLPPLVHSSSSSLPRLKEPALPCGVICRGGRRRI